MSSGELVEWGRTPMVEPTAVVVEIDGEVACSEDVDVGSKATVRFDRSAYGGEDA